MFSSNTLLIIMLVVLVGGGVLFFFMEDDDDEYGENTKKLQNDDSGGNYDSKQVDIVTVTETLKQSQARKAGLRKQETKGIIATLASMVDLKDIFINEQFKVKLLMAGFRNRQHISTFSFLRMVVPIFLLLVTLFYTFVVFSDAKLTTLQRIGISVGSGLFGYFAPGIYLSNIITKRTDELKVAFPDALDLLLICVEAGMTIELALSKVAKEIGFSSKLMAEEITITVAELSYLRDRREAYENLAIRTGLPEIKSLATSLSQSEKYGTSVSQTLRVISTETKEARMAEAERKAASLPPKLTVPMILFFVPVLFGIVLGPGIINVMDRFASTGASF